MGIVHGSARVSVTRARMGGMEVDTFENERAMVQHFVEMLHDSDAVAHLKWLKGLRATITENIARIKKEHGVGP